MRRWRQSPGRLFRLEYEEYGNGRQLDSRLEINLRFPDRKLSKMCVTPLLQNVVPVCVREREERTCCSQFIHVFDMMGSLGPLLLVTVPYKLVPIPVDVVHLMWRTGL